MKCSRRKQKSDCVCRLSTTRITEYEIMFVQLYYKMVMLTGRPFIVYDKEDKDAFSVRRVIICCTLCFACTPLSHIREWCM